MSDMYIPFPKTLWDPSMIMTPKPSVVYKRIWAWMIVRVFQLSKISRIPLNINTKLFKWLYLFDLDFSLRLELAEFLAHEYLERNHHKRSNWWFLFWQSNLKLYQVVWLFIYLNLGLTYHIIKSVNEMRIILDSRVGLICFMSQYYNLDTYIRWNFFDNRWNV